MYLDNLPICVESDRCIDMPEFFLWTLKLAETIEQVSPSHVCCAALSPEEPLGSIGRVACAGSAALHLVFVCSCVSPAAA